MSIKRNKNASIWEVLVLYVLQKSFPSFEFTNEYPLKDIPNQSNINLRNRCFDIYSQVKNIAVEVSRLGAHHSQEHLLRDMTKQEFVNQTNITMFHLRDKMCENKNLSNVIKFSTGENTKDILFPVRTLKPAIDKLIKQIENLTNTKRAVNVNYGRSIDDILEFYESVSGKVFDETAIIGLSDKELSDKLDIDLNTFKDFYNRRNLSSGKAFLEIQNNRTKFNDNGFLTKNSKEQKVSNAIIAEKEERIKMLEEVISQTLGKNYIPKSSFKQSQKQVWLQKTNSAYRLAESRKTSNKIIL